MYGVLTGIFGFTEKHLLICIKNTTQKLQSSYLSGQSVYGDCIVIPKTEDRYEGFSFREALMLANNFAFNEKCRYDGIPVY